VADELPSGDKAVYLFLEILAFCFALASVDAFVAKHWLASAGYVVVAIVLFVAGIKWPQIKRKLSKKPRKQPQPEIEMPLEIKIPTTTRQPSPVSSTPLPREMVDVTPEHLIGFYRQGHTSVQASKLAEAFVGKWMKVTGHLGDILGT
jgi:hypothetical protein